MAGLDLADLHARGARPAYQLGNNSYLVIISNVDGLYTGVHRGARDFIVAVYSLNMTQTGDTNFYTPLSVKQYGSDGDDIVLGAELDENGSVYVFGQTNGFEFDGVASGESNKGGNEGFVYKIDIINNTLARNWDAPRFIGTVNQDRVLELAVGRSDATVLAETQNSDQDLFALKVSSQTGQNVNDIAPAIIASSSMEYGTGIKHDHTNSGFYVMVDSESTLPDPLPTPSLSRDINLLLFVDDGDEYSSTISKILQTNEADYSTELELLAQINRVVIGGYTEGEFTGNTRKSTPGTDAFISVFTTDVSNTDTDDVIIDTTLQFGTLGNDKVIDVEVVNDEKFLVLWSAEDENQNDVYTYRISAFSSVGEMLSKSP